MPSPTAESSAWEGPSNKISECEQDISDIRAALEPIIWSTSRDVGRVVYNQVEGLKTLAKDLSRARAQINKIAEEHEKELQKLKELTQAYESKLIRQNSEIERLKRRLSDFLPSKPLPKNVPTTPGQRPTHPEQPNDSRPVESQSEAYARSLITEGRRVFENCEYEDAQTYFSEAQKYIQTLTPDLRKRINTDEVSYFLTVCTALDPKLDLTKRLERLVDFLNDHANSRALQPFQLAHANHLLSQLYIQLGDLQNAAQYCERAYDYTSYLPQGDWHRYEPTAISIRINELQGKNDSINDAIAKSFPQELCEWFRGKYSFLRPKGSAKQPSNPLRPQPPGNIPRAPTWSVPRIQEQSQPVPQPSSPRPDQATRNKWLDALKGKGVNAGFQSAIVRGDIAEVNRLVALGRPLDGALHLAALFGELEIAQRLIDAGSKINQPWTMARLTKTGSDGFNHTATPMHLAVGAQQCEMIDLLKRNEASLEVPSKSQASKKLPSAPPRYVLSEGWLRLIGCNDSAKVIRTIDALMAAPRPWDINARLNHKSEPRKTILDYAYDLSKDDAEFRQAVIDQLKDRGAN